MNLSEIGGGGADDERADEEVELDDHEAWVVDDDELGSDLPSVLCVTPKIWPGVFVSSSA